METLRHHFGFKKDPFPQDVPIKDLFPLPALGPLEQRTFFSIDQKAISVITGDVGSGKSTSLRYVASKCHTSAYELISIVGGDFSTAELYRQILRSFGERFMTYQLTTMTSRIRELILDIASRHVVPLLIIDEAHLLHRPIFTQLHTLAQFEFDSKPVMPMILCGQDLLLDHLLTNATRPLASRILGKNHLQAIRREVMEEYLNHHIALAGSAKKLFSDEAIFAIHQGSGGLLRKANALAKTALFACAEEGSHSVSADHVRMASTEVFM